MEKEFYLIVFVLFSSFMCNAQLPVDYDYNNIDAELCNDEKEVCDFAEKMPSYQGDLANELEDKIVIDKKIKYRVGVMFILNCEGKGSDFVIVYGENKSINSQLIEQLELVEKWIPAQIANKNVDCKVRLHFEFKKGKIKLENKW